MSIARRWPAPRLWLWGLLALYLVGRVIILFGGHVYLSNDTPSYALRDDPALNHGSLVSLTGHAPREWGVPIFYALFGSDHARAVGQWVLDTVAWAALAAAVTTLVRTSVARVVLAAAVVLLALTDTVGNWDFAMLSESLSISLGVLALALLIRWSTLPAVRGRVWWLVGSCAAAFWWTFTRPDIRVFTVVLVVVLAVVAWRRPARRRAAVAGAVGLAIAIGWCTTIQPNVAAAGPPYSFFGVDQAQDEWMLFRLRAQVLPDPEIRSIFIDQLGMPVCPAADEIAQRVAWDMADFAQAYRDCPDLQAWGRAQGPGAFTRFARVAPLTYGRMTLQLLNQSWQGPSYAQVPWIIPRPVQKLAFPGRFGLLWVALGLVVAAVATRRAGSRRHPATIVAAVLAGACVISTVGELVYGTGEFWRFGVQEAIGLRLAVTLALVAALDTLVADDGSRVRGLRSMLSRGGSA